MYQTTIHGDMKVVEDGKSDGDVGEVVGKRLSWW